ncbi:MAG TPA: prolyl-tRNA synthetase associated domain-containing protein [Salinivirgaceae bacterium]|nr:prolyl-tRNA synthetase associated domain-containing protein [Salinivirgaceae bacterium]
MIGQPIVYQYLQSLNIEYQYFEHPPIPIIEDAKIHKWWIDAVFCKNLFFRNHKGNKHYLVILHHDSQFNLRMLEQFLKQGKLSFASEKRMQTYLGLNHGSVSPFGLIHDKENHVHVYFDPVLKTAPKLSFHPNDNRATLILKAADFWKYMNAVGNSYEYLPSEMVTASGYQ